MEGPTSIDPDLPWGYWLRLERSGSQDAFVANDGRTWPTIRRAFWDGRLGMPAYLDEKVLEMMLAVLVNRGRGGSRHDEQNADLFDGSFVFQTILDHWLQREGFLVCDPRNASRLLVTPEGRSVMLMLGATRPPGVRAMRPTLASVRELVSLSLGPLRAAQRMYETEAASARWHAAFARRTVAGKFTIVLEKRDVDAPVPVTRVAWSQSFANERVRDVFYGWLCARVDRWGDWAGLAWSDGGSALTTHLMSLVALGLSEEAMVG